MKNVLPKIVLIICLIIGMVLLTGSDCNKSTDASDASSNLVGIWVLTSMIEGGETLTPAEADLLMTLTLNADGTYSATYTTEGETDTETGTWSATSTMITFNSTIQESWPYTLSGNTLRITSEGEGIVFVYTRI